MVNQVAITAVIIEKVLNSTGVDLVFTELAVAVSDCEDKVGRQFCIFTFSF